MQNRHPSSVPFRASQTQPARLQLRKLAIPNHFATSPIQQRTRPPTGGSERSVVVDYVSDYEIPVSTNVPQLWNGCQAISRVASGRHPACRGTICRQRALKHLCAIPGSDDGRFRLSVPLPGSFGHRCPSLPDRTGACLPWWRGVSGFPVLSKAAKRSQCAPGVVHLTIRAPARVRGCSRALR